MSFAAVQKHVAVLERAGLVTKERRGREQLVHTEPDGVRRAARPLDQLEGPGASAPTRWTRCSPRPQADDPKGQQR